jgi:quercetin dioxygenase-like cupin family protein
MRQSRRNARIDGPLPTRDARASARAPEHKESTMKPVCTVSLLLGFAATAWAADPAHYIIVTPNDLKWSDVPSLPPGAKIAVIEGKMNEAGPITARIKLPPNYRIPPHWHPGVERVTVLQGTFNYGMGDQLDTQKSQPLVPGSTVVMPPEMHHYVWTQDETVVQLNVQGPWGVTYVNPADDPRKH